MQLASAPILNGIICATPSFSLNLSKPSQQQHLPQGHCRRGNTSDVKAWVVQITKPTLRLSFSSGGASGSRMDLEVQERPPSVPCWGVGVSARHQPGQA